MKPQKKFFCKMEDKRIIEFKSRDACLRYYKHHKGEVAPYGCFCTSDDQARNFTYIKSYPEGKIKKELIDEYGEDAWIYD